MKVIHVLLIIILILSIILGFKIYNSKNQIISKETENIQKLNNDKLELEEIKEIINKSENINNYCLKTSTDAEYEVKYKDGKFVLENNNNNKIFIDYEDFSEKAIIITENNKTATYVNKSRFQKIDTINLHKDNIYLLINNCEKYEINEMETFNNYECVSLTVFYKYVADGGWNFGENMEEYDGKIVETNILIDKETGVIMKITSKLEDLEATDEYYYKFNCLTEEDVTVPDLSEYKIVEAE